MTGPKTNKLVKIDEVPAMAATVQVAGYHLPAPAPRYISRGLQRTYFISAKNLTHPHRRALFTTCLPCLGILYIF